MTKSRTLPALLLLATAWPAAAFGQSQAPYDPAHQEAPAPLPGSDAVPTIVTADEAVAMSRRQVKDMVGRSCPPERPTATSSSAAAEGVSRYRLPLPVGPCRDRRASGRGAARRDGRGRHALLGGRRDQQCGGGLDMIGIGFAVVRGIAQALANRD